MISIRVSKNLQKMKKFKLNADDSYQIEFINTLPRSFDLVQEALTYAKSINAIPCTYLVQHEEDGEDIIISMQEIADMVESGEDVQELDMF